MEDRLCQKVIVEKRYRMTTFSENGKGNPRSKMVDLPHWTPRILFSSESNAEIIFRRLLGHALGAEQEPTEADEVEHQQHGQEHRQHELSVGLPLAAAIAAKEM
jgi:hypothetical protein